MSDYTQLQTDIVNILADSQVSVAQANEFIRWAEYKLQRDLLSDGYGGGVPRQMLARSTGQATATATFPLPADFHQTRSVSVGGRLASYATPSLVPSSAPGYADADVVLDYYQRLPALSGSNLTTWLTDVGYDAYLWGSCLQYIPWGKEDTRAGRWAELYNDAVTTVKATHSGKPRGSLTTKKTKQYGAFYTVIGTDILFSRAT